MSIFDFFKRKVAHQEEGPQIEMGRYSDAFKDHAKQQFYEDAIQLFESGNFIHSVALLLDFLRDDLTDNVQYDSEKDELFFEILQGSKRIIGRCNSEKFVAISEIATLHKSNIGLYRRLLDKNYLLKYVRFCIKDEKQLTIKFDSFAKDASPRKLYAALREISINADKYDDILVDEFQELSDTNAGTVLPNSAEIAQLKANYLRNEISKVVKHAERLSGHNENFHNGMSFLLLNVNYKLDYLLKPEGYIMELLEMNHRLFFTNNTQVKEKKNKTIINNFRKILERTDDQMADEFYDTIHTFGYTNPSSHEQLTSIIQEALPKMGLYNSTKEALLAQAIPGYIVGCSLFNYSFPPPDVDLLSFLMQIMEHEFYSQLGYKVTYVKSEGLNAKLIKQRIAGIVEVHEGLYPEFRPNTDLLNFESKALFAHSFLDMISSYKLYYRAHTA